MSDEIVVTAQRRSENIQQVPITISAISGDKLRAQGISNPQELAQYTPNVSITSPAGAGSQPSITIRGIGLNDTNTNNAGPNGVYVDEFYVSAPSAQGLSLFDMERIEVLKGPQGTLYGRNTSGGAINFVTARPTKTFEAYGRASYASFNSVNAEGAISGPLTDTLSARLSANYAHSDGFMKNLVDGSDQNRSNSVAVRGQLQWEPNDDLKILLKTQYTHVVEQPVQYRMYGAFDPNSTVYDRYGTIFGLGGASFCSAPDIFAGKCVDAAGSQTPSGYYSGRFDRTDERTRINDVQSIFRVDYALGTVDLTSITGYNYNKRYFPDVNRRSIGTPYRRAKGTPLALHRSIDVGRGFRAAGGVGRA